MCEITTIYPIILIIYLTNLVALLEANDTNWLLWSYLSQDKIMESLIAAETIKILTWT